MMRARVEEARLALMLLTRLPAGQLRTPVPAIGTSAWAFPLVGLVVGALAGAVLAAALAAGLPAPLAAGLALGSQVALTGALHEDGLADCADGFWGGRDLARRLEILRDSRIGTYGAAALVFSLGLRWQALALLAAQAGPAQAALALVVLGATSRTAPALLLAGLPPARSDGLGHGASGVTRTTAFGAAILGLLPALALPAAVLPLVAVQAALVLGLARLARSRIGGQTGDVLGAGQQLAEIGGALVLCSLLAN